MTTIMLVYFVKIIYLIHVNFFIYIKVNLYADDIRCSYRGHSSRSCKSNKNSRKVGKRPIDSDDTSDHDLSNLPQIQFSPPLPYVHYRTRHPAYFQGTSPWMYSYPAPLLNSFTTSQIFMPISYLLLPWGNLTFISSGTPCPHDSFLHLSDLRLRDSTYESGTHTSTPSLIQHYTLWHYHLHLHQHQHTMHQEQHLKIYAVFVDW